MAKKSIPTMQAPPTDHARCAHETCDVPAMVRLQLPTGWANLCEPHYVMHFDGIARLRCAELGLNQGPNESKKEWLARCMAYIKSNAKLKTFDDAVRAEDEWSRSA